MNAICTNLNKIDIDTAYDNTHAIENFPAVLESFQARSDQAYQAHHWKRDLRYGAKPRQRYDFLSSGIENSPTYIFIHGGYWSNCAKEDFAFISSGPLGCGMNVILAEYTLAPEVKMVDIVKDIAQGVATLISVGAGELNALVRHSTEYAITCERAGEKVGLVHVPEATHFSILNDLANPHGWQMRALSMI